VIINSSSRSSSSNRGQVFFVCTKNSFRCDSLFFLLGEVCSRLVAVGALVGSMDNFLLFLLVAECLVSFVFGRGDGNKCIDALGGPSILLVEVSIILMLAFGDAIVKELEAGEGCLGLESLWV